MFSQADIVSVCCVSVCNVVEELVNIGTSDALLLSAFKGIETAVSLLLKHGVDANTRIEESSVLRSGTMFLCLNRQ